ncbi:uncharacterized protein FFE2_15161 [Fusarium fujikuroi]|nr:uncharacterized protein FFE2_15161 [Fusarium fujikuroi]SCV60682.1 uncharacterized protein FFFS_15251 [Fusarium fujikuroi]
MSLPEVGDCGLVNDACSSEEELFLPKLSNGIQARKKHGSLYCLLYLCILLIISLLCLSTYLALSLKESYHSNVVFKDHVYSPVEELVHYKNLVFTTGFGSERTPYQGPPTPERDALWDDLYLNFGISRIPRDSAAKLMNKTLPIPGEPGQYVIELNVFHQLHCLNMIRKRLYIEDGKYDPNHKLTGIEHLEHCYDALRQSLMCSADITPLPWVWSDKAQEAKEVARVMHTCRDFDILRNWAREHAVHHFDKKTHVQDDLSNH